MNQVEPKKSSLKNGVPLASVSAVLAENPISGLDDSILLGVSDTILAKKLISEVRTLCVHAAIISSSSFEGMRQLAAKSPPTVIFLDGAMLTGRRLAEEVGELADFAPLVVLGSVSDQKKMAKLVVRANVDCISRVGEFVPFVAALIQRRLRQSHMNFRVGDAALESSRLAEIFRHEINNPLTGILGNAELVLAHRDQLLPIDAQRLETVVELAVRLRESVLRVSSESDQGPQGHLSRVT